MPIARAQEIETVMMIVIPMRFQTSNLNRAGRDAGPTMILVAAGLRARHFACMKAHWYQGIVW